MARLYLTLDSNEDARNARKETIAQLISAEIARSWDTFGPLMSDRAAFLADVAPLFVATEETRYYAGGDEHHFPYTLYAIELMKERATIPYDETEQATCPQCGKDHPRLWTIDRVPLRPWGCFPVFRIGGKECVIDPTLPHGVSALPRDARPVSPERAAPIWHSTSHYFGSTFDAGAALRETVAALNAGQPAPPNGWTVITA